MINSQSYISWETVTLAILAWLLTYTIHSSFLIGTVWLLTSRKFLRSNRIKDLLWKTAIVGGIVTASIQSLSPFQPFSGRFELSRSSLTRKNPEGGIKAFNGGTLLEGMETGQELRLRIEDGRAVIRDSSGTEVNPLPGPSSSGPLIINRENIEELKRTGQVQPYSYRISWMDATLAAWLLIGCLLYARLWMTWRRWTKAISERRQITDGPLVEAFVEMCRASETGRRVWLSCSSVIRAPMALSRVEICLPERALSELDLEHQEMMLAHELAHIMRRDIQWLKIYAVLETIFFFQPLNRLARLKLQEEAEYLCDDWAVERTGRNLNLARCLAEVAAWIQSTPQPEMVSSMGGRGSTLVRRVERLLEDRPRPLVRGRRVWPSIVALCLLGAVTGAAPIIGAKKSERLFLKVEPGQGNIRVHRLPDNKGVVITPDR